MPEKSFELRRGSSNRKLSYRESTVMKHFIKSYDKSIKILQNSAICKRDPTKQNVIEKYEEVSGDDFLEMIK